MDHRFFIDGKSISHKSNEGRNGCGNLQPSHPETARWKIRNEGWSHYLLEVVTLYLHPFNSFLKSLSIEDRLEFRSVRAELKSDGPEIFMFVNPLTIWPASTPKPTRLSAREAIPVYGTLPERIGVRPLAIATACTVAIRFTASLPTNKGMLVPAPSPA